MSALQQPTVIGQLPISTYTVMLLGFRTNDGRDEVIMNLHRAASKVISTFPVLGGQVVLDGKDSATTTGTYRTIPYEPHSKSFVHLKDCSDICPSLDELLAAKAPTTMLDGEILSPKRGFFHMYDPDKEVMPVFNLQANFIKGGLLLCFAAEHNCLDMNAQGQAIRLFAAACGEEPQPFSDVHIAAGNIDATAVFPFLEEGEEPLEHTEMRCPSSLGHAPPTPRADAVAAPWVICRISRDNIAQLKHEASQNLANVPYVSSDDTICAFLWKRLVLSRLVRFADVKECTFARTVNARRLLKLPAPEGFMSHFVVVCSSKTTVADLETTPLATLAQNLRRSLHNIDEHYLRSLLTTIRDEPDKTRFSYGASLKSGLDMLCSSFANLGLQQCEFGPLLGKALFARRPRLADAEGVVYLMPKTIDGDVDVLASLRVEDVEALRRDPEWTKRVEYIG
jgi:hypothetical protein